MPGVEPTLLTGGARRAFTFVEILAAMLFMAIVIPVTVQAVLLANRVGITAERKRVAAQLANRVLTETIVTESWRTGDQKGDFGDDWPGFRWELTSETWSEDTMRLVTVRVFYKVQEREWSERLSTLADESENGTQS
jgi:general secretion pathway protein I